MSSRGVILGLRGAIVLFSLGAAGCHPKPGTLPVDSPVYAYRAPDTDDDDDSDTNDGSDTGSAAGSAQGSGSGAQKE